MQAVGVLVVLAGFASGPDPACMTTVAGFLDGGALLTSGTDLGLALVLPGADPVWLSEMPGSGRNCVTDEESGRVIFKECVPGDPALQRLVGWTLEGGREILIEAPVLAGPFEAGSGFIAALDGSLLRLGASAEVLDSFRVEGLCPSVCEAGEVIYFVDGAGDLHCLDESRPVGGHGTAASVSASECGSWVLVRRVDGAFDILDSADGRPTVEARRGLFPCWSPDGEVLYCASAAGGDAELTGQLMAMDPRAGLSREIPVGAELPAKPRMSADLGLLVTDAGTGALLGGGDLLDPWRRLFGEPVPRHGRWRASDDPRAEVDVPWMHQRWDTPDWFDGSWSCGPTSCLMAAQYYDRLTPDSIWCSSPSPGHWSRWGNYVPELFTFLGYTYDIWGISPGEVWVQGAHGFICRELGGAYWSYMTAFLSQCGLYSAWAGTAWSTLTGELDSDWPVVCSSTIYYGGGSYGHIILFCGYYEDHTVIVNDPYGDANETGCGQSWQYPNGKACLYDWPGYNNGHLEIGAVNQLFFARSTVLSEPDTLVDDLSHGFDKCGPCQYWHETSDAFGSHAWWTWSTGSPPDTCFAKWHPVLPAAGRYEILAWVPGSQASAIATYRISTPGGPVQVSLDQSLYSSEWASLGDFRLCPGDSVYLGDFTGTGGQPLAFDALRFHLLQTSVEEGAPPGRQGPAPSPPYPNPVALGGRFSVELPDGWVLEVFDLQGRLVGSAVSSGDGCCSMCADIRFPAGVYCLRARSATCEASSAVPSLLVVLEN